MQRAGFAIAVFAFSAPVIAQQTITCSSQDGRRHFCAADTRNGVILVQEHSDNVCQQGSTWSYTRQGITVSGGCSADFQVGASGNNNPNGYNGYGNRRSSGNADNNGSYGNGNGNGSYGNNGNGSYGNGSGGNGQNGDGSYDQNGAGQNGSGYPNGSRNGYNNGNQNGNGNNSYSGRQKATVLPSGTRIDVRLEQSVNPQDVNRGDYIPGSVVRDVTVNGRTVIPAGTQVQAKVLSAHGSPLDIRLDSTSVNGERYRLTSSSIHSANDAISGPGNNGAQSAGQEIGAILGALTDSSRLPKGSVYTFRLTSSSRPTASYSNQSKTSNQ